MKLRLYQQPMGWADLGISAGFQAEGKSHSQVLAWQMPGANCHEGEAVSAVLPFCHLYFTTSCPHGFGLRKMSRFSFLFFSLDFSQENNIDWPLRRLVLMLHAHRA